MLPRYNEHLHHDHSHVNDDDGEDYPVASTDWSEDALADLAPLSKCTLLTQ